MGRFLWDLKHLAVGSSFISDRASTPAFALNDAEKILSMKYNILSDKYSVLSHTLFQDLLCFLLLFLGFVST